MWHSVLKLDNCVYDACILSQISVCMARDLELDVCKCNVRVLWVLVQVFRLVLVHTLDLYLISRGVC